MTFGDADLDATWVESNGDSIPIGTNSKDAAVNQLSDAPSELSLPETGVIMWGQAAVGGAQNGSLIPLQSTSASDIYCNRELNIAAVRCVGFDMDWTLAQYTEEFDQLAYRAAARQLVEFMG